MKSTTITITLLLIFLVSMDLLAQGTLRKTFTTNTVRTVEYRGSKYAVIDSKSNKDNDKPPLGWEFAVNPMLTPRVVNNKIDFSKKDKGDYIELRINIEFINDELQNKIKYNLQEFYNTRELENIEISKDNVTFFELTELNITSINCEDRYPTMTVEPNYPIRHTDQYIPIILRFGDEQECNKFIVDDLESLIIKGYYMEPVAIAQKAKCDIKYSDFQNKTVQKELSGNSNKYVTRRDLRNLIYESMGEININCLNDVENPKVLSNNLLATMLKHWSGDSNSKWISFSDITNTPVYNRSDITPDLITNQIKDIYRRETKTQRWYRKKNISGSGSGSYFGIGGSAGFKHSYSDDELEEQLRELDIDTEIKGEIIKPKSIKVYDVGTLDFSSKQNLISSSTVIRYNIVEQRLLIDFSKTLKEANNEAAEIYSAIENSVKSEYVNILDDRLSEIINDTYGEDMIVITGNTPLENAEAGKRNGQYSLEVDLSEFNFSETPQIFTSLRGSSSHWTLLGTTAIYSPSSKGFTVHFKYTNEFEVKNINTLKENIKTHNWELSWVCIGKKNK